MDFIIYQQKYSCILLFFWNWIYSPRNIKQNINHNIYKIQDNESIMCGFYCVAFIVYMLAGKTLLDYTNLFSPSDYKKSDKIIYKYFKDKYGRRSKSQV